MVKRGKSQRTVNQRLSPRKEVEPLRVSEVTSLENLSRIAMNCEIVEASAHGFLLQIKRDSLIPKELRGNLNLDPLIGQRVSLKIEAMNLEVSGKVVRAKLMGKSGFQVAIDYSDDAPEYWRECLSDLIPVPGELKD